MAKRSFSVVPRFAMPSSPNFGPIDCPFFMVPVDVWDGTAFRRGPNFLWDTESNFCMVSRRFATRYGFRLHERDDRLEQPVGGIGGDTPGWLTTRYVQFPLLSGRPDLKFKLHFVVLDQDLEFPILGIRDVLLSFAVESLWEECVFRLRRDHEGS
jgi:hypothetical protein